MQILGDLVVGVFIGLITYKVFVKFGWWVEKRGEKAINDIKKEPKQNG